MKQRALATEVLPKPPVFVAEISANHLGRKERAEALIDLAAESGADAVKFQTYDPKHMVGNPSLVMQSGPWAGRNLLDLYQEAWTPSTWQRELFARARRRGLVPFSSPFSAEDVDFLEGLKCPIYKIASFEITDLELIRYAAGTKKPMIISTGMATLHEIEAAVDVALVYGARTVTILKCTSGYPAPVEEANLNTLRDLAEYFIYGDDERIQIGLSDHTLGHAAAIAAVALGAAVIEKHLTVSRKHGGPDAGFSAEPLEFREMVGLGRQVAATLGHVHYGPTPSEEPHLVLRRALWVVADVRKGDKFTTWNLRACRPGYGRELLPRERFIGHRAAVDIPAGSLFEEAMAG